MISGRLRRSQGERLSLLNGEIRRYSKAGKKYLSDHGPVMVSFRPLSDHFLDAIDGEGCGVVA